MELFKMSHTQWAVIVKSRKEKNQLFKVIEKRDPFAVHYMPGGERHEQFTVTVKEADMINEQIRSKPGRST